jgi:alpha-tubulin suppressor-like RCC1 family protein
LQQVSHSALPLNLTAPCGPGGVNFDRQLGNGDYNDTNTPGQIGTGNNWVSISAGLAHGLALKADGTCWGWGRSDMGQLGHGTWSLKTDIPVKMTSDSNWISISAGFYHSLGIKSDGTLWAWGYNSGGALGDGTTNNTNKPVQIGSDENWGEYCGFKWSQLCMQIQRLILGLGI